MEPLESDVNLEKEIVAVMDLFIIWLRFGPEVKCVFAANAILHYARNYQYKDLRNLVGPDTIWEFC